MSRNTQEMNLNLAYNKGNNITDVQTANRRLILNLIHRKGVVSRVSLASISGLKQATITLIVNEFIKKGLVEDCGLIEGENGRRVRGVRLVENHFCTIGVRITSAYYNVGIFNIASECIAVEKTFIPKGNSFQQTLVDIKNKIEEYLALSSGLVVLGTSVGVDASFTFLEGICYHYDSGGKFGINVSEYFRKALPFPVYFERSADFMSYWIYNKNLLDDMDGKIILTVPISSYIEISILSYGSIYHGAYSSGKTDRLFYVKTKKGDMIPAVDVITVDAVTRHARELLQKYPGSELKDSQNLTHREIIEAYRREDPLTVELYEEMADALAQVLLALIQLLAPHFLYIGDEIPQTETFMHLVKEKLKKYSSDSILERTQIGFIPAERITKMDPSLRGGSYYVIDQELYRMEQT